METVFSICCDLPILPAAPGTRQMLARDQASHQMFLKKHDPTRDIDLATVKKEASVLNPGIQSHTTFTIGDKEYKFTVDNTSSETILSSKAGLPTTAKKVTTGDDDELSFATERGIAELSRYEDTVSMQGVPLSKIQFLAEAGTSAFKEINSNLNVDGIWGVVRERKDVPDAPETTVENIMGNFKAVVLFSPPAEDVDGGAWKFACNLTKDVSSASIDKTVSFAPLIKRSNRLSYSDDELFETGITYGSEEIIPDRTVAYFDILRTFISLPTDAFKKYQRATGAVLDEATGLLIVTEEQYKNLATLKVRIGEASVDLIPNAQIWPRRLNNLLGGEPDKIYLAIVDSGVPSGAPFDVVLGYAFCHRFFMIVDPIEEQKIGFGTNEYTYAELN